MHRVKSSGFVGNRAVSFVSFMARHDRALLTKRRETLEQQVATLKNQIIEQEISPGACRFMTDWGKSPEAHFRAESCYEPVRNRLDQILASSQGKSEVDEIKALDDVLVQLQAFKTERSDLIAKNLAESRAAMLAAEQAADGGGSSSQEQPSSFDSVIPVPPAVAVGGGASASAADNTTVEENDDDLFFGPGW